MALPQSVHYKLFRRPQVLAAEVTPTQPDRRAWVYVTPLRWVPHPPPLARPLFRVRFVEFLASELNSVYREWLDGADMELEEYVLYAEMCRAEGEQDLEATLGRWLSDPEKLDDPSRCRFPL